MKSSKDISDEELVRSCIQGKRSFQEILYRRFADEMFKVCKYYADDRDEACDFLQEGFIKVFKKLEQFQNGSLEGWIRRIMVNTALQAIRKKKVFEKHYDLIKKNEEQLQNDEEIEYRATPEEIVRWVNDLPQKSGLIFKLYVLEGYTHPEISEYLDISVGTSKSQLSRARTLLKERFKSK